MNNIWPQGSFDKIPFSKLLSHIWHSERSGRLEIKKGTAEKRLDFKKGNIIIEKDSFDVKFFFKTLIEKKILNSSSLKKCENFSAKNKTSLMKASIELGILSPSQLWKFMEDFIKEDFFPLFDCSQAEYFFDQKHLPQEAFIIFSISTLNLILQGVRQMQNFDLIKSHIPQGAEPLQILSPDNLNKVNLEPPEEYLFNLIANNKNLKDIYDFSELGKKETQKIVFVFFCLGALGLPQMKTQSQSPQEFSPAEVYKILDAFNSKCSYIFKYISKEIGPVALNVLEKCIEDTKPNISPFFQNIKLGLDGRIETNSILKTNISVPGKENQRTLLRDLNEILAAEILAVKKTLGNDHESMLVKNLEKTGELN